MRHCRVELRLTAVLLLVGFSVSAALAQESRKHERGGVQLGAFVTDNKTSARLDSSLGIGSDLDLEADLGLENSTSIARLGAYLWLNDRHRFDIAYFDLSRSRAYPVQEAVTFGDETFSVNTVVNTQWDLNIVKADYTFAMLNRERGFLGITGGLYVAETALQISEAALGTFESQDLTAPLPVIGLRGDYAITDRITLHGAAQLFDYSAEDVEGRLSDVYVGADYGFGQHWAVGVAYNAVSMNLAATDDDGRNGSLDWGYDGVLLYLKFTF